MRSGSSFRTATKTVLTTWKGCDFLLLSEKKLCMAEISVLKNVSWCTVSRFFNAWEGADGLENKIKCLRMKEGRGAKKKLPPVENEIIKIIESDGRSLNTVLTY